MKADPPPDTLQDSDRAVLVGIGEAVRQRLLETDAAAPLPAGYLDIFSIPDFLSADECARLVELIDADLKPSRVIDADSQLRTSATCDLPFRDPLVAGIERRICALLGLPRAGSESPQGQRCDPDQHYGEHADYFAAGTLAAPYFAQTGGQRTWTAMIYLKAPDGGGRTIFPRANVAVMPVPGMLVTWNNMDRTGHPNLLARHLGEQVEVGTKYILTKWFRERPWTGWGRFDPDAGA